jgi:hypothetical protein
MKENHLRTINKGLKEEVRKLQKQVPGSAAASPAPGSAQGPSTPGPQSPVQSHPNRTISPQSTPPSTPHYGRILGQQQQQQQNHEDDVNVEYLKNVLLGFLEQKDRRVCIEGPSFCTITAIGYSLLVD